MTDGSSSFDPFVLQLTGRNGHSQINVKLPKSKDLMIKIFQREKLVVHRLLPTVSRGWKGESGAKFLF